MSEETFRKMKIAFDRLGFVRVPRDEWIDPSKGELADSSPEGLYPAIIVPEYHLRKRLYLMDYETYERMWEEIFKVCQGDK